MVCVHDGVVVGEFEIIRLPRDAAGQAERAPALRPVHDVADGLGAVDAFQEDLVLRLQTGADEAV